MLDFKEHIGNIPDFPKEGILYRDIQPLLLNPLVFDYAINEMGRIAMEEIMRPVFHDIPTYWVGIESRGFIFASALAKEFGGGVKLIRKPGKLPNKKKYSVTYDLEYGTDTLEMAADNLPNANVIIVDDVYATGGTMNAAEILCRKNGCRILGKLALVDIGIKKDHDVKCLINY